MLNRAEISISPESSQKVPRDTGPTSGERFGNFVRLSSTTCSLPVVYFRYLGRIEDIAHRRVIANFSLILDRKSLFVDVPAF